MAKIKVLQSAQDDFDEIRKGYRGTHTAPSYEHFKTAFRTLFKELGSFPNIGSTVEEAKASGLDVRQRICEQMRVVYTYDRQADIVYIRMFLPTHRDFLTHLTTRILRPIS
jgi:plasmid stabilization system protein ParE